MKKFLLLLALLLAVMHASGSDVPKADVTPEAAAAKEEKRAQRKLEREERKKKRALEREGENKLTKEERDEKRKLLWQAILHFL